MFRTAPLLLAATACLAAPPAPADQGRVPPAEQGPASSLLGRWRLVALDGRAPAAARDGRELALTFDEQGYGGDVGCNSFGGQGLVHEGRFYGGLAMSTAMACGAPLDGQESAVQRLLASGPGIERLGPDRIALVAATGRIELARAGSVAPDRLRTAPMPLIGTAWRFGALDGQAIGAAGAEAGPTLTVEGERFTFTAPCLAMEGGWTQAGPGAVTLTPARRTPRPCNRSARGQAESWEQALRGPLRYVNGPNGEILLAGNGHWLTGDLLRRGSSEAASLAGRYQAEAAGGAAGAGGARPAELILARNSYQLWDGCNRTEGLAIAFERALFLHGNGLSTLANCGPGAGDDRFRRIVLSGARIGRIPGGLLLSSPAGTLRLRRMGDVPPGAGGVTTILRPGTRFALLSEGGGTLTILSGTRFRLTQPCGTTEGRWRASPGDRDGSVRFGPDGPAGACDLDPAAQPLRRVLMGNVDVAIGPNRDIALFAGRFGAVPARLER